MKRHQIRAMLKKGNLSPFMVSKLVFNDNWRNSHMQEPLLTGAEKQALVDKIPREKYHQFQNWNIWFSDIDEIYSSTKEHSLDSEKNIFQMLWFIEKDLIQNELKSRFKVRYPMPVTKKQYQDIKKNDREDRLKKKYSIVWCLIEMIEDKLPGRGKVDTLEDYICEENENKIKDRKFIVGIFKKAVTDLISLISQGKIKPTRKAQLLPSLKTALKKTPDQIAAILLSGIYADAESPVKILESSTITGEQLYKHDQGWAKYIDTFYPETGGGYAIVQDPSPLFLDKQGYYKPINQIDDSNGVGIEVNRFGLNILSVRMEMMSNAISFFQFYRMILDALSEYLGIPLNQSYEEIGLYSFKHQAGSMEFSRQLLFRNLKRFASSNKELSDFISEYKDKTVEEYYPSPKVVEFCKNRITNMSEYTADWFYDIKDFYMKEERIKEMSSEEIEHLRSAGNKEQVKHFMGLVEKSNQE